LYEGESGLQKHKLQLHYGARAGNGTALGAMRRASGKPGRDELANAHVEAFRVAHAKDGRIAGGVTVGVVIQVAAN